VKLKNINNNHKNMTTIYVCMKVLDIVPFVFSVCNIDQLYPIIDGSHNVYANIMEPNVLYEYSVRTIGAAGAQDRFVELFPCLENEDSR
jgi:hypothetical protein